MGTESYLIANLVGKCLRKIGHEIDYDEFVTKNKESLPALQKNTLQKLFLMLKNLKNELQLADNEMLCTLNLLLSDIELRQAEVIAIGDGVVVHNTHIQEYEQHNLPDYLGYHLYQNFEDWCAKQIQKLSLTNIQDISISSDGIYTFDEDNEQLYIEYLCIDTAGMAHKNMLQTKIGIIEKQKNKKTKDDIGIIRIILPQSTNL